MYQMIERRISSNFVFSLNLHFYNSDFFGTKHKARVISNSNVVTLSYQGRNKFYNLVK